MAAKTGSPQYLTKADCPGANAAADVVAEPKRATSEAASARRDEARDQREAENAKRAQARPSAQPKAPGLRSNLALRSMRAPRLGRGCVPLDPKALRDRKRTRDPVLQAPPRGASNALQALSAPPPPNLKRGRFERDKESTKGGGGG